MTLKVRLPSGNVITRKFRTKLLASELFDWIFSMIDGSENRSFLLKMPGNQEIVRNELPVFNQGVCGGDFLTCNY